VNPPPATSAVIIRGPVQLSRVQSEGTPWRPGVEVLALPADPELLFDGPPDAPRTIVLAHGGAGMDSPFMESFAEGLAKRGFRVVRFEYPYMAAKRVTGKQKPPGNRSPGWEIPSAYRCLRNMGVKQASGAVPRNRTAFIYL
jgi:hypothetical protein